MTQIYPELWDDTDHRIVALRLKERRTWRTIGAEVNLDHTVARKRFYRAMAQLPATDTEERRTEENEKLDDHEEKLAGLIQAAILHDDLPAALQGMKQMPKMKNYFFLCMKFFNNEKTPIIFVSLNIKHALKMPDENTHCVLFTFTKSAQLDAFYYKQR